MAYKGIDVRQTGDRVIFRAFLQDLAGALVTSGTATLRITRLRTDGTLDSYDFNDNTFKTTALTTATVNLTHRQSNNNTVNTGLWTSALTTVSGFTAGDLCFAHINHASAYPSDQVREWQYGSEQGDLSVTAAGNLKSDVEQWVGATPDALSSGKVPGDIKLWKTGDPNVLVAGRVDASVGSYPGNAAQTGDGFARLGAPAGASVSADVAAVKTNVDASKDILEGDETIDTTTDPTQFHQVVKRKGTATELIRKKLYRLDGSKVNAEADVVARRLEP